MTDIDLNDPSSYDYDLPDALIAHHPPTTRGGSRLLIHRPNTPLDEVPFEHLRTMLAPNDLLVFNNTQVVPCRLFARKSTGGRVEVFVLGDAQTDWNAIPGPEGVPLTALIRSNKPMRAGQTLTVESDTATIVLGEPLEAGGGWSLTLFAEQSLAALLDHAGHVPLPPYIVRRRKALGEPEEVPEDRTRYQTVYARHRGAVAAPTAGLHFTTELLERLRAEGVDVGFVTLHVGMGTFKPLGDAPLDTQQLHNERYTISQQLAEQIERCTRAGGRIVAVGTTSARALEDQGMVHGPRRVVAGAYQTQIFIKPGYMWHLVDGLVTNFHLPRSSLLVMVSALIGYPETMALYQEAIRRSFRFYSYGDAALLWRTSLAHSASRL